MQEIAPARAEKCANARHSSLYLGMYIQHVCMYACISAETMFGLYVGCKHV